MQPTNSGKDKKFSHLKHHYPNDGQTCKPEGSTRPGGVDPMPSKQAGMGGPDGYHDSPAVSHDPGMGVEGPALATTPGNPTRGEGSGGVIDYPHEGAPERTTSVGSSGVEHTPGVRPRKGQGS
jgi:hypothetical protein